MVTALLAQIDLPSGRPDGLETLMRIAFVLIPLGLIVGTVGGVIKSRGTTAAGIVFVMLGTGVFLVAVARFG